MIAMPFTRLTMYRPTSRSLTAITRRGLIFLLALILTVGPIFAQDEIKSLGMFGYPAIFITSLLGGAALFLPASNLVLIFSMGDMLNPISIGLTAGLGAALGEMTGYFVGYHGQVVLEEQPLIHHFKQWMRKASDLMIFSLAVVPNPLADLGGIVAGALKIPVWRFFLVCWIGKSLRFTLLASLGALA